jgi:iron complex transport system substrate-binding protein
MARDASGYGAPTRRDYLKGSGALLGGGLLAGCVGEEEEATPAGSTETPTETATEQDRSYSVEMEPMGEVTFESVPDSWMAYFSTYGDMAIALGQLDALKALIFTENWPLELFESLPDVDVSFDSIEQLHVEGSIDKEAFYSINADVHLMDPNFIAILDDTWSDEDFEEIATNVGPIVGNNIRRRGDDWHDYRYYSLYEAFEKIAQVFQEQDRYRALKDVHDTFLADVQSRLPAEDERPQVGLLSINSDFENGAFYAYPVHQGNGHKQYRDLGIRGAFEPHIDGSYAEWDYEQLLDVDPDILVFQYGFSHTSTEEFERRIQLLREDPIGQELSAVKNDRLYRGGTSYQGPLINLLQTEIAAKQFYPETFGEWTGLDTLATESERLFDHQQVADIINGNS